MELKELIAKRRSVRKFTAASVPQELLENVLAAALAAPSSRNSRSTRLLVVEDHDRIVRMAEMRDYGSSFMKDSPLVVVVLGDTAASDLWRENAAIAATILQLACVDEGLASCWVHIDRRPRLKSDPQGGTAADYLRGFLPIPGGCEPLCAVAIGYAAAEPVPLPPSDDTVRVIRI